MRVRQKGLFSSFSQTKVYTFRKTVGPVPLASNNFYSQHRLSNQVIISENQGEAWQGDKTYNNTRLNRPNELQTSMMIETLRNRHICVMKCIYNSKNQPQNQNQNNNQEKLNVCIQVRNTFSNRSCGVLEIQSPCSGCISSSKKGSKQITQHSSHFSFAKLAMSKNRPEFE